MNDFRKHGIGLWILCILLLGATNVFAGKFYHFYADGTIKEISTVEQAEGDDSLPDVGEIVTLDVEAIIMDNVTGREVFGVHPGQQVILWCFFNRLGDLEVPFDQLIGHEISFSYRLFGELKHQNQVAFPIASGDEGVVGVGTGYTVPADAQPGKFLYVTSAKISGFQVNNNRDRGVYAVVSTLQSLKGKSREQNRL